MASFFSQLLIEDALEQEQVNQDIDVLSIKADAITDFDLVLVQLFLQQTGIIG